VASLNLSVFAETPDAPSDKRRLALKALQNAQSDFMSFGAYCELHQLPAGELFSHLTRKERHAVSQSHSMYEKRGYQGISFNEYRAKYGIKSRSEKIVEDFRHERELKAKGPDRKPAPLKRELLDLLMPSNARGR
jgi:hypothetical protein